MTSTENRTCWIFDMDGTITIPMHDFEQIKQELGIHPTQPLLESILQLKGMERKQALSRLEAWEEEIAWRAAPSPDAVRILEHLEKRKAKLGILTRNTMRLAGITLEAAGLSRFFHPSVVLGRECADPKPSPAGVQAIIRTLGSQPSRTVMVGDYIHDVEAGHAAGCMTILVRRKPMDTHVRSVAYSTYVVDSLDELWSVEGLLS